MGELIEREPLLENLKLLRRTRAATATPEAMSLMLRNLIKDAPAVDAAKVVRGRWVKVSGYVTPGGDPVWKCSECGKGVHVYGIEHGSYGAEVADGQWVSCPNCGAKMDGETTSSVTGCAGDTFRGPAGPFSLKTARRAVFRALEPPEGEGFGGSGSG